MKKPTLSGFKDYLDECEVSGQTKKNYYLQVRKILNNCQKLNVVNVSKYIKQVSTEATTWNRYVSSLRKFGAYAGWKWVSELKRKKEYEKPKGLLLDEEIEWAIKQFDYGSRDWMFLQLFAFSAARPSEIIKLRVSDINLADGTIIFWNTKNGENRQIAIPVRCDSQLREYLANLKTELLFPTLRDINKHISVLTCRTLFYKALDKIHITKKERQRRRITFYQLKHSCVTRMAHSGVNIFEMKSVTGHKRLESLLRYYENNIENMRKNYGMDRMAVKFLDSKERYKTFLDTFIELDKKLIDDEKLSSELVRGDDFISLTVRIKH